jgi:uncharacterized protein (DUF2147 family)
MALSLALALVAQAATPAAIDGRWRSPGGNSIIEIAACGVSRCGTVVWASAKAKQDSRKATDQLVGTLLLTNLQQDPKGRWRGKLFIPDKNMRVTAKLELIGDQQLKVSGCAAGRSLCKSALWIRTSEPLPASD